MKKVTFPVSKAISPGTREIRFQESIETDVWWMGNFVETKTEIVDGIFTANIPDPGFGNRGSIVILDRTFEIVRDDDEDFWGPDGRAGFVSWINQKNLEDIQDLADSGLFEVGPDGMPAPAAAVFSKSALEAEGKTLMAHIMAELKIFPSVGQARKNGWDKPLELGDFSVTKKKIRFRVVD
jgi:hypothetical protein